MPGVLRWLSTKLNCSSQVASLLAATAGGDVEVVRGIIKNNPDLGLYNTQGGQGGGRSALTIAAERGDLEVLKIVYEGAVKARGEAFAKQNLNAGAERGQTPLMRACIYGTPQHVECIGYLLSKGADPFSETEKGETCLHLAAKNAYTECLREILAARVSIGGGPPTRLADAVLPYTPPVKFVDMRNAAGFTPLHLATLKNSPAAMEVLLGAGASMEAGISDAGNTPHLAKGSTALHIAAARGSQPCCSVLLDFQLTTPGVDLRQTRNQRGLKASQLARLAGHDGLALILSERQSQGGGRRVRGSRRRRRHRDSLHTGGTRAASSPDAVLALLVQRAKLLLALREVGLDLDAQVLQEEGLEPVKAAKLPKPKEEGSDVRDAKDEVAAAVAEFTELWKKGELEVASKQTGSLLSSLIPADMPVAKLPDEILGDSENGEDSYAAAAMVQAALNAMACFSPVAKPLDLPPTELKPTSPIAAAMVVQAAIRKLAGKASSNTTPAATLLHTLASHAQQQPSGGESQDSSALGASTPQQAAEHRSRQRLGGAAHPLHTEPLPARAEASEAPGQPDEQVRKILSKARRRQRRNALRSIEVAALETSGAETPTVEASARSSDDQSLGPNPLMDNNPLFPSADDAMGPGERRRAALRQAALRTAPALTDHQPEQQPSADSVPEPRTPRPHLSTPFSDGSSQTAEEQLPPAFPWETVAASGAPPANPFTFSSHMPSSKQHRPTSSAAVPPRTPSKAPGSPRTSFDSQPAAANAAQASPLRSTRASQEAAASATPSSQTESVASGLSRRRLDASDAHSTHSAQSATTPGSRMLRTDSSDDLTAQTASRSLTPQVTPQNSQGLFSPDISPSGSDSEGEEDDLDSDTEAKEDMEPPKTAEAESRCAICMDQPLQVGISTCDHKVCYGCAYQLCSRGLSPPTCPFCRGLIVTFISTGEVDRREAGKAAEQEAGKAAEQEPGK